MLTFYSFFFYLSVETSWRPPPCPPAAADSWGLEPDRRRRRPEHRHGVQGTEGQHPVGSMPGRGIKEELKIVVSGAAVVMHHEFHTNTLTNTHFT